MVLRMDSKASHTKGASRTTYAIAPCSFTANRARMADIFRLPTLKPFGGRVSHSLMFCPLPMDVFV